MHRGARTVLCGGRSVMVVPTASRRSGTDQRRDADLAIVIRHSKRQGSLTGDCLRFRTYRIWKNAASTVNVWFRTA
jgi:hypothetical protein